MDRKPFMKTAADTRKRLARLEKLHRKRLGASIKKLQKQIISQVNHLKTTTSGRLIAKKTNLLQAQKLYKETLKIYEETYNKAYRSVVKDFDKITTGVAGMYTELGEAITFSGADKIMIAELKKLSLSRFASYAVDAQDKFSRALYDSVITGAPHGRLRNTIRGIFSGRKDVLGRSMTRYAKTHARDAVRNFQNQVTMKKATDIGLKEFLYHGNVMRTTRTFCAHRAGNIYTKKQIESWTHNWPGKSGPAMTDRGGYNCRHNWQPIKKEWVEGKELGAFNKIIEKK